MIVLCCDQVVVLLLSLAHYSACAWHYIGWPGDSPEHYEQVGLTMLQSISNWGYDSPPIGLQFTSNWVVLQDTSWFYGVLHYNDTLGTRYSTR